MALEYTIEGLEEFEAAVRRNPEYTRQRGNLFITRALAEYRKVIYRNPWRLGMSGGGSPVRTGNLRDTHQQEVGNLEGRIYPTASYAEFVHGGTRRMKPRPWLDYAEDTARPAVEEEEGRMMDDILNQLAS